jgi:hypothetical protein
MSQLIEAEVQKFLAYIKERATISARRAAGETWPWSQDPIFQTKFFCCVVRDDDRTSREAREYIQGLAPREQLAATMWFRLVNREETLRAVVSSGMRTAKDIEAVLEGLPLVFNTVAYRVQVKGGLWNKPSVARMISRAYKAVRENWQPRSTARYTCEALRGAVEMGPFISYQAMQDLRWTGHRYIDENTWCLMGLGAARGMRRLTGDFRDTDLDMSTRNRLRNQMLTDGEQEAYLPNVRLLVERTGLNAFEVEHNLCELDKYCRIQNGETGGRGYSRRV